MYKKLVILFFLLTGMQLSLSAKQLYLSPVGNDANNGSQEKPIKTLKRYSEKKSTTRIVNSKETQNRLSMW